MVYRNPGPHRGPKGTTYAYMGVNDAEELKAALASGWRESLSESKAEKIVRETVEAKEAADDVSAPTRAELEQKADELGIGFNSRTKNETLAARIAEALV
jgi:ribosomal protein L32E